MDILVIFIVIACFLFSVIIVIILFGFSLVILVFGEVSFGYMMLVLFKINLMVFLFICMWGNMKGIVDIKERKLI